MGLVEFSFYSSMMTLVLLSWESDYSIASNKILVNGGPKVKKLCYGCADYSTELLFVIISVTLAIFMFFFLIIFK